MALTISDTSYAGTVEANHMITQATFGLETIAKKACYVKDGIKKQHNIPKVDIANVLQDPSTAIPTSSGTFTVTGMVLDPKNIRTYVELDPRLFEEHFYAEQLSQTLLARELPVTAENVMMQLMLNRAFEKIEAGIHMGSTTYTATLGAAGNGQIKFFDGIIKAMVASGSGAIPVGSWAALTTANIIGKFDAALALVPKAILADTLRYEKLKIMVSVEDFQKYEAATTALTQKGNDVSGIITPKYRGYQVVPLAGIPENTFYVTKAGYFVDSNIWVGINSFEDMTLELKKLQANAELVFFKGLFKVDVKVATPAEFVIYTDKVTADFSA